MHILSVNQDRGIGPNRSKGAAVHLRAMRHAFRQLGATVSEFDECNSSRLKATLQNTVDQGEVHLIYERYALGQSTAARFAKKHGIPFVLEVNAPLAAEQQLWREKSETESDRLEDAFIFHTANFIAAVSTQVAEYARVRGGRPNTVFVCPNGVDTGLFHPVSSTYAPAVSRVPKNAFVLGFHGRERPWHGFDLLVDVSCELVERSIPVHLLVIGEGDFSALDNLQDNSYTRLPWMPHEDIPACISRFDVLPLTYSREIPFYFSPLKLAEAMACGSVPVVPSLGDLPMIITHEYNGLLYKPGDREALVSGLMRLAGDAALKKDLSINAIETARMHGWEHIATRILDHFGFSRGATA